MDRLVEDQIQSIFGYLSSQLRAVSDLRIPQAIWHANNERYDPIERSMIHEAFNIAEKMAL